MKLYLVRHGETHENIGTLLMGRTDGVLSPRGEDQSRLTGHALKHVGITKIYTSPLGRCRHTAELINESLDIVLEEDDRLIERDFGIFTNAAAKDVSWELIDNDTPQSRESGVESLMDMGLRISYFVDSKLHEHHDDAILAITHSNPLRLFYAQFLEKSFDEVLHQHQIHNCGISIFELKHNAPAHIVLLDDVTHLKEEA